MMPLSYFEMLQIKKKKCKKSSKMFHEIDIVADLKWLNISKYIPSAYQMQNIWVDLNQGFSTTAILLSLYSIEKL